MKNPVFGNPRCLSMFVVASLGLLSACTKSDTPEVAPAGGAGGSKDPSKTEPGPIQGGGGTGAISSTDLIIPSGGVAGVPGQSIGGGNGSTSSGAGGGGVTSGLGGSSGTTTTKPTVVPCTIQTRTPSPPPAGEPEREFNIIKQVMGESGGWNRQRLTQEAFRQDALILATDKSPVDVIWRRTQALIKHLKTLECAPDMKTEEAALEALRASVESSGSAGAAAQLTLFTKIATIRRTVAFRNPLLDFDKIMFVTHRAPGGERHMVNQYFGYNAAAGGSLYVLEDAFTAASPKVTDLLAGAKVEGGRLAGRGLAGGSVLSPDLSYDGKTIVFANSECGGGGDFSPGKSYHIFSIGADGTGLRQLTDGTWNEFDPVWLPNGRVAFISERIGGYGRCHTMAKPTFTIHSMKPDGTDIGALSYHETNEWHPSVTNDGYIVYTRWDYVDRDSDVAHHLWMTTPEGRDPRSTHGNYPDKREMRPWMEMSIRSIPGSSRFVSVAAPHHGHAFGTLLVIDPTQKDDRAMSQVRRLTPEVKMPESEKAPGVPYDKGAGDGSGEVYATPWPLSEDFHLVVYDQDRKNYGIYLLDSFGNKEFIYRDKAIPCLDPIPFRPRPAPPIATSSLSKTTASTGTASVVAIADVRLSEVPLPKDVKIKEVRVMNLFAKDTPNADQPNIGTAAQSLARGSLGTAPVEDDGSAFFEMPSGVPVYFQLLDENGVMVQTMRSDTYTHPGDTLSCIGCHEAKGTVASATQPSAFLKAPAKLRPEPAGSYPLTFPRLVQPVLDTKCVPCHVEKKALALGAGQAFASLGSRCVGRSGGNGVALTEKQYSIPGEQGARASRLYATLSKGHYNTTLTAEEMRRITLWLDNNCNFYGAYTDTGKQAAGELVLPKYGLPPGIPTTSLVH